MYQRFLILLLLTTFGSATMDANQEVQELKTSILEENFYNKKLILGAQLGAVQSEEAKSALIELLSDESYWNRSAAVQGLKTFDDDEIRTLLVKTAIEDHMIEEMLVECFRSGPSNFSPIIQSLYNGSTDTDFQKELLKLLSSVWTEDATDFLKSIVEDNGSENRVLAFELIATKASVKEEAYIRSFIGDPVLQETALLFVLNHGNEEDLQLFQAYLDEWSPFTPMAFQAVNQWQSEAETETLFFETLHSDDNRKILTALATFEKVQSARLLDILMELSQEGVTQQTRRLAVEQLLYYDTPKTIPCLEAFLKESFIPRKQDGWDVFLAHVTIGFSSTFQYLSEKMEEKAFNKTQEKIRLHLKNGDKTE